MEYKHVSVMLNACIQALRIRPEGVYIDCTAGLGGHSEQIARRLTEGGRLLCIDQDTDAVRACRQRLAPYIDRVAFIEDNYSNVRAAAAGCGVTRIDGALIDLGVSSYQLDNAERGFSYNQEAPLDMRMDTRRAV